MPTKVHTKIRPGKVIDGYEIISLIGAGGFGGVYKVKDRKTNQLFAMKTEDMNSKRKSLPDEIEIMRNIEGDYFPKLRASGTDVKLKINYFVMNIYGPSLTNINQYHDKRLELNAAYSICYELIDIIQKFHSYGYVHCDIKPSNFLLQENQHYHMVLIDFGLSEKHIDPVTNQPFPFKDHLNFSGTRKYASIGAHKGFEQGRRDDLMSWFYSFLELAYGPLPWHLLKENSKVLRMKENLNLFEISNIPRQINEIYNYISGLRYEDAPDYDRIKSLFKDAMSKIGADSFHWDSFVAENYGISSILPKRKSHGHHKKNNKKEKQYKSHSMISYDDAKNGEIGMNNDNNRAKRNESGNKHHHRRFFGIFSKKKRHN